MSTLNICLTKPGAEVYDVQVKGEAQGDSSALKEFVQHLNKGPSAASVNKVEQNDIEPKQGEKGFTQK